MVSERGVGAYPIAALVPGRGESHHTNDHAHHTNDVGHITLMTLVPGQGEIHREGGGGEAGE